MRFLKEFDQLLVADANSGYNGVVAGNQITRTDCWAHLRRKFIDAEKAAPEIAHEAFDCKRQSKHRVDRNLPNGILVTRGPGGRSTILQMLNRPTCSAR